MSIRRRLALWLCPALGEKPVALAVAVPRPAMDQRTALITLAEMYGRHCNYRLSTVSTYAVNDGKRLPHLKNGGGCTVKTAERMMAWFDANWPRDLAWPRDIPRPSKPRKDAA